MFIISIFDIYHASNRVNAHSTRTTTTSPEREMQQQLKSPI